MKKKRPLVLTEEAVRAPLEGFASAGLVRKFHFEPAYVAPRAGHVRSAGVLAPEAEHGAKLRWRRQRRRRLPRIPVKLPSGDPVPDMAGAHDPLLKQVVEEMCSRWAPGGVVVYIGDAEDKFLHLEADYLKGLGVVVPPPAKMPDVAIHDTQRNWLLLIEAVTSAGPVDAKRRNELKELFGRSSAGLVFVSAFATRAGMRRFLTQISWETEVWVAEDPDHMIHFNGERFLGPYPDALPQAR